MWNTSPVQARSHKRLGDRRGPACYTAHQAPPRAVQDCSSTRLRTLMWFRVACCRDAWATWAQAATGESVRCRQHCGGLAEQQPHRSCRGHCQRSQQWQPSSHHLGHLLRRLGCESLWALWHHIESSFCSNLLVSSLSRKRANCCTDYGVAPTVEGFKHGVWHLG